MNGKNFMQIAINISITFAFMFWPIIFMMSPMMLGAPGADNDKSQVISVMLFLSYPIGISLLLWIFGGSYFGVKGFKLTIICVAVIVIGFALFGYFGTLSNLAKGIANTGYSIANGGFQASCRLKLKIMPPCSLVFLDLNKPQPLVPNF